MNIQPERFSGDTSGTVVVEYATAASLISVVIVAVANQAEIADFLMLWALRADGLW